MKPQAPAQRKPKWVRGPSAVLALGCTLATTAWAQSAPAPESPGAVAPVLQAPVVGVPPVAVPAAAAAPLGSPAAPAAMAPAVMPGAVAVAPPLPAAAPAIMTARVLSVTSVAQAASATRVVCAEPAEVPAPTSGAGAVAGALVGAAVGSQVGGGSGNALATAAGLVGGAILGDKAEQGGRTQMVRNCVTHSAPAPALSFQVVYELAGQQYSTVLPYHPGASLQVQLSPVAVMPGVPGEPVPTAQAVVAHTVVLAAPPYAYSYGPYGYYGPYWRAPVVVGVGAAWGRPHRGWHGRRW